MRPTPRRQLAHRWLAAFGPGTMADLKWWTGWTVGLLKRALAQLDTVEVQLDGGEVGLVLAGDEEPVAAPEPWVALWVQRKDSGEIAVGLLQDAGTDAAAAIDAEAARLRAWLGDLRVRPRFRTPLERELVR